MTSIMLYLVLLIVGALISYKGWVSKRLDKELSRLQMICLYALLLTMGMRIGFDKEILKAFGQIGLHATVFAVFSIVFSVLLVYLLTRKRGKSYDH